MGITKTVPAKEGTTLNFFHTSFRTLFHIFAKCRRVLASRKPIASRTTSLPSSVDARPLAASALNNCGLILSNTTSKIRRTSSTSSRTNGWLRFSAKTKSVASAWLNSSAPILARQLPLFEKKVLQVLVVSDNERKALKISFILYCYYSYSATTTTILVFLTAISIINCFLMCVAKH